MDFGSFENSIDKNIETDNASDKFDQKHMVLVFRLLAKEEAASQPQTATS